MKRKKKKIKIQFSEKLTNNEPTFKINYRYTVIIIVAFIFLCIVIYYPKSNEKNNYPYNPPEGEVKIIESEGNMPQTVPTEVKQDNTVGSPMDAESPATIEDLGGDRNTPANLDELLRDKEIKVNE